MERYTERDLNKDDLLSFNIYQVSIMFQVLVKEIR